MQTCLPHASIEFLRDLSENNSKVWFDDNRKRYERDLKKPARALIATINAGLDDVAPGFVTPPNKAISRINRDIRFSKDKTPYHTHVWAAFMDQSTDKRSAAGFYVGIRLDEVGIGAGCWMPPKPAIDHLRTRIAAEHTVLQGILDGLDPAFGDLRGESYKRVPKPFPKDHPAATWLKLKGMHLARTFSPEMATEPDFAERVVDQFVQLKAFVDFISGGLRGA